ncbi:MAG: PPC domain-containing protein [Anaerolineae bacterium]|nr:PPC domain-containing protein [Anaerolineae bacterium]
MLKRIAALSLALVSAVLSQAQTPPASLLPDTLTPASFDLQKAVNIHTFSLSGPASVLVQAVSDSLGVGLLITDDLGQSWARGTLDSLTASALGGTIGTRAEAVLPTGVYFVTSFVLPGATLGGPTPYQLRLTVVAQGGQPSPTPDPTSTPPTTETEAAQVQSTAAVETEWKPSVPLLLADGIQIRLTWAASVDLNLEVRDPSGGALRFNARETNNGGTFGLDANAFCQNLASPATETATWAGGFVPSGSYEILVTYRQSCEQTPQPAAFVVDTTVNGVALPTVQAQLSPPLPNQASVYIASFILNPEGTVSLGPSGVYPDSSLNILPAAPGVILAQAQPIERGSTITGALYGAQSYLAYSFEAAADEVVTISLEATSGNLDTLLQLIDSAGNLVAVNDDANASTNSQLANQRLTAGGRYTVVATRYGKEIGGTEGTFRLSISEGAISVPPSIANLPLVAGDIQVVLAWTTSADLQLLVRDPSGEAVYDDRDNVRSGGLMPIKGNINCTRAAGNPYSYIYWPQGTLPPGTYEIEVWYQDECRDTTPTTFDLAVIVDGRPVLVERQTPTFGQRYVISFAVAADRTARAGRGGYIGGNSSTLNYASVTPIAINLNQQVVGTINSDKPFDVYAFSGRTGQRVTILMANTSGTLDTKLFLVGPSGREVADNDDAGAASPTGRGTDAIISNFTLPEDGQYLVIATRFATIFGGTQGGYTLLVQGN